MLARMGRVMHNGYLRIVLTVFLSFVGCAGVQAVTCGACKGLGMRQYWKTCEKCGGSGMVHFNRTTSYNSTFSDGRTRRFHDGKAGQGVTRCSRCQYGLGNKHNGMVSVKEKCRRCGGSGQVSGPTVDEVEKTMPEVAGKKNTIVGFDADLELAKQNINTNVFVSYKCRYRKECEHCQRLSQKNGLTKSYCEQCYVCKKKRQEKAERDAAFKKELEAYDEMLKDLKDDAL